MLNQLEQTKSSTQANTLLLQSVLEGLTDGVLILSDQGEWIYSNYYAYCICQELNQGKANAPKVPEAVWRNCQALIDSRDLYPDDLIVIESEIALSRSSHYRIRVRWLILEDAKRPYLAVLLEDRCQSSQNRAMAEAQLYHLTPRQAEVWVLRCAGFSYQEIAAELYITVNTVSRHLKEIYAKRKMLIPDYPVEPIESIG
jgi:RNA polymerase sigma factor (sigma-70 family)